jgi:hypothetical protein
MTTGIILALTAWLSFELGRRYQRGVREEELEVLEAKRDLAGRRGTVRLKPLRIRR